MNIIENEFWSDKRPYYILYQDKIFLKNMYAQLYSEFPDVGQIAYIGTSTKRLAKDYSLDGEQTNGEDINKNIDDEEDNYNRNVKKNARKKANIAIRDSNEESEIREYANIKEIKEMNNMLFYKQLLRKIVYACRTQKNCKLCHKKGKISLYDNFVEDSDIFVKMGEDCIWLKKENMDINALNMANVLGDIHLVGYVIEEKPNGFKIIKAIAMYV